jgi:CTP-dependent riboflavin kinase
LSKLFFILYSGENENYVPVNSVQVALSLVEENSSRYLQPEELLKIISELKDVQQNVYLKGQDIKNKLESVKKVSTEMMNHLTNLNKIKKQVAMEPETAESYEKTVNILFVYLQRQQRFLTGGIYKGMGMVEKNMSNLYKYTMAHDLVYRTI